MKRVPAYAQPQTSYYFIHHLFIDTASSLTFLQ